MDNVVVNEVVIDETISNNVVVDSNTVTSVASDGEYTEMLNTVHTDLGVICCFLVFFTLVIILKYVYKFFNMFFVI